ncbi:ATP-binding cassette sub-family D member 2 [Papilio machaon]|uniref:ATP-binding cassette sub-family D member 2 n=1 Tax=Papilio machaon TaxID=76193 RepID=A0A0N0PDT8_PAPMA|nr:ATP-binding cassette sub-family D member 2 [Papilio machaon]
MPAILTKIREQASRVQPGIAVGVGVGVALAACAVYAREKKQPPPCHNNNNYKVAKNGTLHSVQNGGGEGQTCGRCGEEQCALCRGDADTDNKQNIAEADEAPTPEEHVPGLNLEFLRQLLSLVRIMVPGLRSQEVALLAAHTLCLFSRTFLSIYVASLEGSIVKHIVQKDLRHFTSLLVQWFGIAVPATFVNSMIRYLEGRLALAFRTRLVNHAYELYFKNQTYYRVANLDARIENADHRLTEDVSVFTQSVAHLYSSLTKPCFDLLLIVLTLATYSNKMKGNIFIGPGMATVVICLTGQLLRLLSPRFGALAGEEARMRANLRHAHSRLITHAEEVAFYGGHKVELGQLQSAYKQLVVQMTTVFNKKLWYVMLEQFCMKYVWSGTGMVMLALPILTGRRSDATLGSQLQSAYKQLVVQMTTVFNKKLWYVMLEQFCMKYVWSGTGMVMLALPILTGRRSDESNDEGISARTEYMTTSRNLLNSAADAIERLMSSYKEVVTLAGYATRVSDMLVVFGEVARGRCVRAVHATPTHPGFQVTYPSRAGPEDEEAERRATHILRVVRLDACAARLGGLRASADWRATLSGGEKQRLAMARMFYHRPVYALLDECTSAVSLETELVMYAEAVRCGITLLSITHRPSVWKYHTHVLEFDGAGNWSFRTLDKDAPVPSPGPPSITSEPTSSPLDSGGE